MSLMTILINRVRAVLARFRPAVQPAVIPGSMSMFDVSSLTKAVEAGAVTAFEAYMVQTPLGDEERAALGAIVNAFKAPSFMNAVEAAKDVLQVITDLKAQIAAAAAPAAPTGGAQ